MLKLGFGNLSGIIPVDIRDNFSKINKLRGITNNEVIWNFASNYVNEYMHLLNGAVPKDRKENISENTVKDSLDTVNNYGFDYKNTGIVYVPVLMNTLPQFYNGKM